MPDPLDALPDEICTRCIALAIDGREAGPLELMAVSKRWDRVLLSTPSLWNHIYVQDGEDEISRISIFLHLSRRCSLHIDIMTALPTMDSLRLIANHTSRVTHISIRPDASDIVTALQMEQWKQVALYILARLSNGLLAPDKRYTSCLGLSLLENNRLYYCIILMQFTMVNTSNRPGKRNYPVTAHSQMWEEEMTRATCISASKDAEARTDSIHSLGKLVSYVQYHGAIRIAIPSCIKLLKDDDGPVRSATIEVLHRFADHIELREAIRLAIPLLITLLEHWELDVRSAVISLLGKLAEHYELHEALDMEPTIQSLNRLLSLDPGIVVASAHLLEQMAGYDKFREALRPTVLLLIAMLQHQDPHVVVVSASLLEQLTEYDERHEALGLIVSVLVKLLGDNVSEVVLDAVSVLGKLAGHYELCGVLGLVIPSVIPLVEHEDSRVVSAALSVLVNLAEYGEFYEFCETLGLLVPSLVKLVEHGISGVRSTAVSLLIKLVEHDELSEALGLAIPSLIKLLGHRCQGVVLDTVSILGRLAKQGEFCGAIRVILPDRD